jgi:hypothetical protein
VTQNRVISVTSPPFVALNPNCTTNHLAKSTSVFIEIEIAVMFLPICRLQNPLFSRAKCLNGTKLHLSNVPWIGYFGGGLVELCGNSATKTDSILIEQLFSAQLGSQVSLPIGKPHEHNAKFRLSFPSKERC